MSMSLTALRQQLFKVVDQVIATENKGVSTLFRNYRGLRYSYKRVLTPLFAKRVQQ